MRSFTRVILIGVLVLWCGSAIAGETGPTLITVAGKISNPDRGPVDEFNDAYFNAQDVDFAEAASFDTARLMALEMHTVTVEYPDWPKPFTFSGPLLSDVLQAAGANGDEISVMALDGYAPDIPVSDVKKYPIILALKKDGEFLGLGDHGPAWLIYPRNDYPELMDEDDSKFVWAVFYIEVR